jgi:hypothetical protein
MNLLLFLVTTLVVWRAAGQ